MTEPVAQAPPASQTTPAQTPAPSSSAPPPAVAAPVAVTRPEAIPENYWDATANTIKPEFGTHYQEVSNFYKTETEARTALAARKPEDIKIEVKLPETVKVPDGMEIKIDEKDPRIPLIRELAIKGNWTQEQVDSLVAVEAQQKIAAHNADMAKMAEGDAKLGPNGPARKQAIASFIKGMKDRGEYTSEEYDELFSVSTSAPMVTAIEKLIAKANGTVPGSLGNNTPPKPAEVPMKDRWYGSTPQKAS